MYNEINEEKHKLVHTMNRSLDQKSNPRPLTYGNTASERSRVQLPYYTVDIFSIIMEKSRKYFFCRGKNRRLRRTSHSCRNIISVFVFLMYVIIIIIIIIYYIIVLQNENHFLCTLHTIKYKTMKYKTRIL
jgi:hypothetical protein